LAWPGTAYANQLCIPLLPCLYVHSSAFSCASTLVPSGCLFTPVFRFFRRRPGDVPPLNFLQVPTPPPIPVCFSPHGAAFFWVWVGSGGGPSDIPVSVFLIPSPRSSAFILSPHFFPQLGDALRLLRSPLFSLGREVVSRPPNLFFFQCPVRRLPPPVDLYVCVPENPSFPPPVALRPAFFLIPLDWLKTLPSFPFPPLVFRYVTDAPPLSISIFDLNSVPGMFYTPCFGWYHALSECPHVVSPLTGRCLFAPQTDILLCPLTHTLTFYRFSFSKRAVFSPVFPATCVFCQPITTKFCCHIKCPTSLKLTGRVASFFFDAA